MPRTTTVDPTSHLVEAGTRELEPEGDNKAPEVLVSDGKEQSANEETYTQTEQEVQKMDSDVELHSTVSCLTMPEKCQMLVQRRRLPRGTKRHATFFYFKSDKDWVNKTVGTLEKDYGFVCGEYDLDDFCGIPLFVCLYDIIITSYKNFLIYGWETLENRHVLDEIETTTILSERIVPILLEDCYVRRMEFLNYVDARDSIRRDIWWPKLLVELEAEGDHKSLVGLKVDEMMKLVSEDASTETEQGVQTMDLDEELHLLVSCLTIPAQFQKSVQRTLPPGKNRHASFIYVSSDSEWVNKTVETLEQDYGFVCCEYELDEFRGIPLLILVPNIMRKSYKMFLVWSREALQNVYFDEIQMAMDQYRSKSFVTILLGDCNVPEYMRDINYVDARDSIRREIWWSKLLMELDAEGNQTSSDGLVSDEGKQPVIEETSTQKEQGVASSL